jgi:membrane-associated HD superfamily phosphohydrolase
MGINPHDNIEFDKSAEIIISHVCNGVKLAKEHNLPPQIIDFIKTHHGNTKVQYFYRSFINKYPDVIPDEAKFTYPGPRPYSKETAIVMLSDSVEAATRSLKTVTEDTISQMVDKIINHLIEEEQFIYTNLTFNDITLLKSLLQKKMANIYHERIEYPE